MSHWNFEIIDYLKKIKSPSGENLFSELVDIFSNEAPASISKINLSYENRNYGDLQFIVHNLKSSCMNIGAYHLGELCDSVESICLDGADFSSLEEKIFAINTAYEKTLEEIKELV